LLVLALIAGALGAYFLTRSPGSGDESGSDGTGSGSAQGSTATTTADSGALPSSADMIAVPAGAYPLGTEKPEANSAETLLQTVDVPAFNIDRVEVSNESFKSFVDQTEASAPLSWSGGRFPADRAAHPVKGVTFEWAQAYCTSLGKRLPSETEWEVAARGADGRLYPWGNDPAAVPLPGPDTYPVGSVSLNSSPFGVLDLVGNVWEWVSDSYDKRVKESERVLRGGQNGWLRRNVTRLPVEPDASNATTIAGFRCAATEVDPNRPALQFADYDKPDPPTPPQEKQLAEGVLTDDDFQDATSGWVEKSSDSFRYGYHPNEYYHLETKAAKQEALALGPVVPEPGRLIAIKTSAFVEPTNTDGGGTFDYGIAFRFNGQGEGLVFVVGPRDSAWRICNRKADGTYELIEQSNRSIPDVVDLEVRMTGPDTYEFRIGDSVVHQRTIPGYTGTGTGLVLVSYAGSQKAHIHFDEFAIANRS
jgi:formylglycine-generating enzyme required for sulfatase activity